MSYDIELVDPISSEVMHLDNVHQFKGGTYALGGTDETKLNITYNYSRFYYKHMNKDKGIRALYGMTGLDSIKLLESTIEKLKEDFLSPKVKALRDSLDSMSVAEISKSFKELVKMREFESPIRDYKTQGFHLESTICNTVIHTDDDILEDLVAMGSFLDVAVEKGATLDIVYKDVKVTLDRILMNIANASYWDSSAENACRPLYQLLVFAKARPDGIWEGD